MRKRLRQGLIILLALVFLISLGGVLWTAYDRQRALEDYEEAAALAGAPDFSSPPSEPVPNPASDPYWFPEGEDIMDPYGKVLQEMDLTELREANQDALGWIVIPDTPINYPLLQAEDNRYYLRHTWNRESRAAGAIFLDCRNSPSLSDFNTLVFGHRMKNNSMFGSLKFYSDPSYWQAHPRVYVTDGRGCCYQYDVFAAYQVPVSGLTYSLDFPDDESKQEYIDFCLEQSQLDTGLIPAVTDQILTLSTCTGQGHAKRWIVQAYMEGPSAGFNP